jgi:serine/threonine-protein phosphatase 2A regulatory subunit B
VRTSTTYAFCDAYEDVDANTTSADIISTVEFDHTGNYLATGDKGGRVVLFERNETVRLSATLVRYGLTNWAILEKNM